MEFPMEIVTRCVTIGSIPNTEGDKTCWFYLVFLRMVNPKEGAVVKESFDSNNFRGKSAKEHE